MRADPAGEGLLCVLGNGLSDRQEEALRRELAKTGFSLIRERRNGDRRSEPERRQADRGPAATSSERRRIRNAAGRRVAERRAALEPVEPPELPRRLRPAAERALFARRIEPSLERRDDEEAAREVIRFQSGDRKAFAALYRRYFDRVYMYLRLVLRDLHDAEDGAQLVFTQTFKALGSYERRDKPFRAWLFTLVRNSALMQLRKTQPEPIDPVEVTRRLDQGSGATELDPLQLGWLTDRELILLVERLPVGQRQVLLLRYLLDLPLREVAEILGKSKGAVRVLHHRALEFLRMRLARAGSDSRERARMRSCPKFAPVLRSRRYALR